MAQVQILEDGILQDPAAQALIRSFGLRNWQLKYFIASAGKKRKVKGQTKRAWLMQLQADWPMSVTTDSKTGFFYVAFKIFPGFFKKYEEEKQAVLDLLDKLDEYGIVYGSPYINKANRITIGLVDRDGIRSD